MKQEIHVFTLWGEDDKGTDYKFVVTYKDPPLSQKEAVEYFELGLIATSAFPPEEVFRMPHKEAQEYFDSHPYTRVWTSLRLSRRFVREMNDFNESRFNLLKSLPDLTSITIQGEFLTDHGVKILSDLQGIRSLDLWSPNVTDDCLLDLEKLQNLVHLGMQEAPRVSDQGFDRLIAQLPFLEHSVRPRQNSQHYQSKA